MPKYSLNKDGALIVRNIRKYWQPTYVIDYFDVDAKNTFITQHTSLSGMSGGPIFDVNGIVYGMDIQHFTRKINPPNEDPIIVRNGVGLTVKELNKAIEQIL